MKHVKELLKKYIEADNQILEERDAFVTYPELIDELQEAIEQDEKENGWIPVSERLPEEDGRYLVTFKYGIKVCMVGYGSCKRTVLGYPIGHGWYSLEEAQYYAEDSIIAWMPIPYPYHESNNEVGK